MTEVHTFVNNDRCTSYKSSLTGTAALCYISRKEKVMRFPYMLLYTYNYSFIAKSVLVKNMLSALQIATFVTGIAERFYFVLPLFYFY